MIAVSKTSGHSVIGNPPVVTPRQAEPLFLEEILKTQLPLRESLPRATGFHTYTHKPDMVCSFYLQSSSSVALVL